MIFFRWIRAIFRKRVIWCSDVELSVEVDCGSVEVDGWLFEGDMGSIKVDETGEVKTAVSSAFKSKMG